MTPGGAEVTAAVKPAVTDAEKQLKLTNEAGEEVPFSTLGITVADDGSSVSIKAPAEAPTGTYTLTYTVTDADGKEQTTTLTIPVGTASKKPTQSK